MKTKLIDTYKIPSFYLPLIANGDSEGLTEEELKQFSTWEQRLIKSSNYSHIIISLPDDYDEPFFTCNPDIINLGCNVYLLEVYGVLKDFNYICD